MRGGVSGGDGFAGTTRVGLDRVVAGGLAVLGYPHGPEGTAAGAAALRRAAGERLAPYLASPSRTVVDLESGAMSRLRAAPDVVDLGDIARADAAPAVIAHIAGASGVPVLLGGDLDAGTALVAQVSEASAVLVVSPNLALSTPHMGPERALCCLGVNGLQASAPWQAIRRAGGTVVTADTLHDHAAEASATLGDFLRTHERVVCLIDAGVLDTGHAAGTPGLNVGGLTPEQLPAILAAAPMRRRLAGAAVINAAPGRDARAITEQSLAAALLALLEPWLFDAVPP